MRVNDLPLEERASPVLYHYTTPRAAVNILKSGEFQLSSVVGNRSEEQLAPKGHPYFLSTTRTRVGDYHRYTHNSAVMFVLDGDWFNRHYKVRPVDYWERAWDYPESSRTRESEDRVFSREATIPADGIRAVHVLVKGQDDISGASVRKALIAAKQKGIPAHLYQDERAWRVQDTAKAIPMDQARDLLRGREASGWGGRGRRYLEPWVELIHKNKTADLSADAAKLAKNIVYYHRGDPTEDMNLGVDLANARKPGEADRPLAVKLISYLKKFDFDTKKMVKDLYDKWAEIKTQEYEAERAATKEDISEAALTEVNMSPSALEAWAKSPEAEGIRAGFEAELIFRDANDGDDDEEYEPDYDMDERASDIDSVIEFFQGGDQGIGRNAANRLRDSLYEEYINWREEQIADKWDEDAEEQTREWMQMNFWEDDDRRDDYRDQAQIELDLENTEVEDLTDEQKQDIETRARELFEEDVEKAIEEQDDNYEEARQYHRDMMADGDDFDESDFFRNNYSHMSSVADAFGIDWPYYTGGESSGGGSRSSNDIADSLRRALDGDYEVKVGSGYHSVSRRDNRWIIEPDGSLDPDDSDEAGLEVVSPPMPLAEALDKLEKVLEWANDEADAYTNSSTGLHMGVSVPYKGGAVDYVKLVLFMGDEYVLKQFGRAANTYAASAMEKLRQNMAASRQDLRKNTVNPKAVVELMQKNLIELASEFIRSGVGESKYTSAHIKDGYIEFRSPGGDYLSIYSDNLTTIKNTMLRFARAMHIASRPDLERREYATKLYKLVAPKGDDALKLFALYASKNIDIDQLKVEWAQSVLSKEAPPKRSQEDAREYEVVRNDTGEVIDIIKDWTLASANETAMVKYAGKGFDFSVREKVDTEPEKPVSRRAQIAQKIVAPPTMFLVTDTENNKRLFVKARNQKDAVRQADLEDESFGQAYERGHVVVRPANQEELAQLQHRSAGPANRSLFPYRVTWRERRDGQEVEDSLSVDAASAEGAERAIRHALEVQGRDIISIDAALAGSTQDRTRQRAQQAQQPAGEFTGRWNIQDALSGEVLHTISGIGNNQGDANRHAREWIERTGYSGAYEIVPEMR